MFMSFLETINQFIGIRKSGTIFYIGLNFYETFNLDTVFLAGKFSHQ